MLLLTGSSLKIVGWGITKSGGNASHVAEELQVATIPMASRRNCTDDGLRIRSKSERFLCLTYPRLHYVLAFVSVF